MQPEISQYISPLDRAPKPFAVVKDILSDGRDMIRKFVNPIPTTSELQEQHKQTLIPEEAQKIKRAMALEQGAIPVGEDSYVDITGFVGSLNRVGSKAVKVVGREIEEKAARYLKEHFNLSGEISDKASKELKRLKSTDYDEIADYFKQYNTNKKPITLYRGIQKGEAEGLLPDRPTSWTRIKEVAQMHTYDDGKVIKIKADPDQVFLDVNSMPFSKLPKGVSPIFDEEEVILKPLKKVFALAPLGITTQFTQPLTKPTMIQGSLPKDNESPNELSVERLKGEVAFRETGSFKKPYETIGVTGDLGKYQVNPITLKSYSKKFLGKEVTPEEFLANPDLQERFFENGVQHLSNLGAKSLDVFLMLWHEGWGDISSARIKKLRELPNVKKYLNNIRKNV